MLVREWMTPDPIVMDENTSIMKATQLMKEHKIHRIPIVRNGKLVGIVSDRDIKEAAPSKATSLDVHELYYLLSEIKVKDIMTRNPITLRPSDSVERAAVIMLENTISGLPVVDEGDRVVGMITQTDIFKVMISITGIHRGPVQVAIDVEDKEGILAEVLEIIKGFKTRIVSVLTSEENVQPGRKEVYVRLTDMDDQEMERLVKGLGNSFKVLYAIREDVSNIPKKEETQS